MLGCGVVLLLSVGCFVVLCWVGMKFACSDAGFFPRCFTNWALHRATRVPTAIFWTPPYTLLAKSLTWVPATEGGHYGWGFVTTLHTPHSQSPLIAVHHLHSLSGV